MIISSSAPSCPRPLPHSAHTNEVFPDGSSSATIVSCSYLTDNELIRSFSSQDLQKNLVPTSSIALLWESSPAMSSGYVVLMVEKIDLTNVNIDTSKWAESIVLR
jgi:hypothetical protein